MKEKEGTETRKPYLGRKKKEIMHIQVGVVVLQAGHRTDLHLLLPSPPSPSPFSAELHLRIRIHTYFTYIHTYIHIYIYIIIYIYHIWNGMEDDVLAT